MRNHSRGRKGRQTAAVSVVKAAVALALSPQLSSPEWYIVESRDHSCKRKGTEEDKKERIAIPAYTDVRNWLNQ